MIPTQLNVGVRWLIPSREISPLPRRRVAPFLVAGGAACVGCGAPPPPSAATVAGCYALVRQDGQARPLGFELPDTLYLSASAHLNPDGRPHPRLPLVLEVVARRPNAGRDSLRLDATHVVPWPPAWQGYYAMTVWRFQAPDSVQLILHANMSTSWDVQLRVQGDSLIGIAEEYSDVIEGHPRIPVAARRAACPDTGVRRAAI